LNSPAEPPFRFEPLKDHHRASFSCGVADLDEYFLNRASQDARRKVAAPFAMVDAKETVLGYYTLSAYAIRSMELPVETAKKLPRYPLLPATLLGRLGVSQNHRGRKLGRLLLMDALYRSWKNTAEVASVGVVAEAYDDTARDFYLHHEFIAVPEHPRKLFIAMKTIEKAFASRQK